MSPVTDQEWIDYKQNFGKTYKDDDEDNMRRELFAKSKQKVEEHNKKYETGEVTFKMGINHMADLTEEEFSLRCGKRINPK